MLINTKFTAANFKRNKEMQALPIKDLSETDILKMAIHSKEDIIITTS
mgnify:CR=1 FL=1